MARVTDRFEAKLHWEMLGPMRTPASSSRSTIIDLPAKEDSMTPNIDDIIRDHVTLTVGCIDRLYLHGYMPKLQTSGGLVLLLARSSREPDPLAGPVPADARPVRRRRSRRSPSEQAIPLCEFEPGQRKDDDRRRRTAHGSPARRAWSSSGWRKKRARAFKAHKLTAAERGA